MNPADEGLALAVLVSQLKLGGIAVLMPMQAKKENTYFSIEDSNTAISQILEIK